MIERLSNVSPESEAHNSKHGRSNDKYADPVK